MKEHKRFGETFQVEYTENHDIKVSYKDKTGFVVWSNEPTYPYRAFVKNQVDVNYPKIETAFDVVCSHLRTIDVNIKKEDVVKLLSEFVENL